MLIPIRQYVAPSDAYPKEPADRSRMWIYLPEKMAAHANLTDEQKDKMYLLNEMPDDMVDETKEDASQQVPIEPFLTSDDQADDWGSDEELAEMLNNMLQSYVEEVWPNE